MSVSDELLATLPPFKLGTDCLGDFYVCDHWVHKNNGEVLFSPIFASFLRDKTEACRARTSDG